MVDNVHAKILAAAAKQALSPLGFRRKGRSRIWFADRGFWLTVVEFQPSGFSKGSYLNVAGHWLWGVLPGISFDYISTYKRSWIAFYDATEFEGLAAKQAEEAVHESVQLQNEFATLSSAATRLVADHAALDETGRGGGWPAYNAAIASGLSGDMETARTLIHTAKRSIDAWRPDLGELISPYLARLISQSKFRAFASETINRNRSSFGLDPWCEGKYLTKMVRPETVQLWRPVGPEELELMKQMGMKGFPPRLPEQPIFYPVLTEEYAVKIARDWNVPASGSGYVTTFHVLKSFLDKYPVQLAGGLDHSEYWIPAEELPAFNSAIVGKIEVVASFYGEKARQK